MEENISVPLGMGHFAKGINYLHENFSLDLESKKEKDKLNSRLDQFCSALKMPPKLALDELDEKSWNTIDKMADLAKGLSTPELAGFLAGFQGVIKQNRQKSNEINNDKFTQLMAKKLNISTEEAKQIVENAQQTKSDSKTHEMKNEISQTKLDEIKKKSELVIKNQKKSNDKPKERSNQKQSLRKDR